MGKTYSLYHSLMMEMKLILLATLASLALGAIPLSRQSPEEDYFDEMDYSEEMDRQYPGFPPRSRQNPNEPGFPPRSRQNPNGPGFPPLPRQNPELDYSEEMDRAIGILTTGNFTLFGVDDAEVEKQKRRRKKNKKEKLTEDTEAPVVI